MDERLTGRQVPSPGSSVAIIYTLFVEAVTVVSKGAGSVFYPFRQIGAVFVGRARSTPTTTS